MKPLFLYSSLPAAGELATLLRCLESVTGPRLVIVRALGALPAPDPDRRQRLRAERAELLESLHQTEQALHGYRTGQWQPDAGRENGLLADYDALHTRLRAVHAILGPRPVGEEPQHG